MATIARSRDTAIDIPTAAYRRTAASGHEIAVMGMHGEPNAMAHVAYTADGAGYLRNDALHPLKGNLVYQLWVFPKGSATPISAGILGPNPRFAAFKFYGPAAKFAISAEPAPGAVTPSNPVAIGDA